MSYTILLLVGLMTHVSYAVRRLERKFPRYHQRLTDVGRRFHGARFEDDPYLDINNTAHVDRLPEPAGKRELELDEFVSST